MSKEGKNVRGPLVYFLLVLAFLMGLTAWTSYQFGQQSAQNTKNDIQFVHQSDGIVSNTKNINELIKKMEILSENQPKDGKDGKDGRDGKDSVSTVIENHTIEQVPVKGDSAYQTWLNLGNSGTEQDFIDSLKGLDARQIEGCNVGVAIGWRYVGDTTCHTNVTTNSLKAK